MRKMERLKKKIMAGVMTAAMVLSTVAGSLAINPVPVQAAGGGKTNGTGGSSSGSGKIILEIIPAHCYTSLTYYVGGSEPYDMSVDHASDAYWNWFDYNTNSGKLFEMDGPGDHGWQFFKVFGNKNNYIRNVYGTNPDGSLAVDPSTVRVVSMTPSELNAEYERALSTGTESILDKCGLIYLQVPNGNVKSNFTPYYRRYITSDYYYGLNSDIIDSSVKDPFVTDHSSCPDQFSYTNDISAKVAVKMYEKVKRDGIVFATDYATMPSANDTSTNIYKLARLMRTMDYEFFSTMYPFVMPWDYSSDAEYNSKLTALRNQKSNFISVDINGKLAFNGRTFSKTDYVTNDYSNFIRVLWDDTFFQPYFGDSDDYKSSGKSYYDFWTSNEGCFWTYLAKNPGISAIFNKYLADNGGSHTWQELLMHLDQNPIDRGSNFKSLIVAFNDISGGLSQGANYYCRGSVIGWNGDGALFSGSPIEYLSQTFYGQPDYPYQSEWRNIDWIPGSIVSGPYQTKKFDFSESIDPSTGKVTLAKILGNKDVTVVSRATVSLETKISVLEIEPYAYYNFSGFDGAKKITKYLGITDIPYNEGNFRNYVDVDCITASEFNGLTKDIVASYDMIIIGAKYPGGTEYLSTANNGKIYFKADGRSTVINGNDFTDRSVNILSEVAGSGVPFILDGNVLDKTALASNTEIAKLVNAIKNNKNVFKAENLEAAGDNNAYQHNLRSVLNTIADRVPFITAVVVNSDSTVRVDVKSSQPQTFSVRVEYDLLGNGLADVVNTASITTSGTAGNCTGSVTLPALAEVQLKNSDYYTAKAFVTYESGTLTLPYYETAVASGTAPEINIPTTNLRDASVGNGLHNLSNNAVKILQVVENKSGAYDMSKDSELLAQLAVALSRYSDTYDIQVDTVKINELASVYDISQYEAVVVSAPFDDTDTQGAIIDEYMNSYTPEPGEVMKKKPVIYTYSSLGRGSSDISYEAFRTSIGLDTRNNSFVYQKPGFTWKSGAVPFASKMNKPDVSTNMAAKLNEGQVCAYPFDIPDSIGIASCTPAEWHLNLNEGSNVVVWYTLGDGSINPNTYTTYRGKDGANNFYLYSIDNVYYTMYGRSGNTQDETKLFVNLLTFAIDEIYPDPVPVTPDKHDLD